MALRRWKPFLAAFQHIDAAIDSASAGFGPQGIIHRDEFKRARIRIVEALCGAADDAAAEEICRLLDDAMAESLVTLQAAAAHAGTQMELLASGEVVRAVGALAREHGSGRVRRLARDVVLGWRAAVQDEIGTAIAAMHALVAANCGAHDLDAEGKKRSNFPEKPKPCPRKTLPPFVVGGARVNAAKIAEPKKMPSTQDLRKVPAPRPNKRTSPPVARTVPSKSCCSEDTKKMEVTKRKLHERYQQAEDAKRRRSIQVVAAPEMLPQQGRRTMQPAVKAPACSAAETRRFNSSSSLRRV